MDEVEKIQKKLAEWATSCGFSDYSWYKEPSKDARVTKYARATEDCLVQISFEKSCMDKYFVGFFAEKRKDNMECIAYNVEMKRASMFESAVETWTGIAKQLGIDL